jgi:hypothetical protein
MHPDLRSSPRLRAVADHLAAAFAGWTRPAVDPVAQGDADL